MALAFGEPWGNHGDPDVGRRRRSLKSLSRPVNLTFVFKEDVPEIPKMKMMKAEYRNYCNFGWV